MEVAAEVDCGFPEGVGLSLWAAVVEARPLCNTSHHRTFGTVFVLGYREDHLELPWNQRLLDQEPSSRRQSDGV
jgi:hypothetical protein